MTWWLVVAGGWLGLAGKVPGPQPGTPGSPPVYCHVWSDFMRDRLRLVVIQTVQVLCMVTSTV